MLKHTRQNRIGMFTLLRHIPDYFSYHLQSGVIFAPRRVPDYCGVVYVILVPRALLTRGATRGSGQIQNRKP
jgi:hypothetical protein